MYLGIYRILMLGNWMIMIQLVTVHWNTLSRNPDIDKVVDETELMEIWNNELGKAKGTIQREVMNNLCNNQPVYGIYLDDNFLAVNTYGGDIMPYSEKKISIKISGENTIQINSRFIISINKNQKDVIKFHTICHEFGHIVFALI